MTDQLATVNLSSPIFTAYSWMWNYTVDPLNTKKFVSF